MTHRVYTRDVVYEGEGSPLDAICARDKKDLRRKYYLGVHSAAAVHIDAVGLFTESTDVLYFDLSIGYLNFNHTIIGRDAINLFLADAVPRPPDAVQKAWDAEHGKCAGVRDYFAELLVGQDIFTVFEDKNLYGFLRPDGAVLTEIGDLETYIKTRATFQHNKVVHAAVALKKHTVILGPKGEVLNP